jgi:hypothetical protein
MRSVLVEGNQYMTDEVVDWILCCWTLVED